MLANLVWCLPFLADINWDLVKFANCVIQIMLDVNTVNYTIMSSTVIIRFCFSVEVHIFILSNRNRIHDTVELIF